MNRPLLFVFACSAALSASAGAAYLAVIGPAPLRFEGKVRPIARALALLPPLLMQDPLPPAPLTNAVTQATATNPPPETLTTNLPVAVVPHLPVVPTFPATNPPVVLLPGPLPPPTGPLLGPLFDPNDPNSLLTAQMLIHYFRPLGTNAAGASVAVPLFIPPRAAPPPPSSTVRYTTP
ncbi:MAG: hypothetical protein FD161_4383 [Limisphaerales bacterium]|nr:MAG: hypothetical protein FD161_4383 [Limisphaerales bacterium]KAG0506949.1 MAG: hypothetical protein E1N63_3891 [Limisphaerales bacterium]TXT49201.1 MAG: hypothetical protein FD140_3210 [Limisphaerales bacterium]